MATADANSAKWSDWLKSISGNDSKSSNSSSGYGFGWSSGRDMGNFNDSDQSLNSALGSADSIGMMTDLNRGAPIKISLIPFALIFSAVVLLRGKK